MLFQGGSLAAPFFMRDSNQSIVENAAWNTGEVEKFTTLSMAVASMHRVYRLFAMPPSATLTLESSTIK